MLTTYAPRPLLHWLIIAPCGTNSAITPVGAEMKVAWNEFCEPASMSAILLGLVWPTEILICVGGATAGNGKSVVIKTLSSYYIYPLKKTPLNTILDKDFLLEKIKKLKERDVDKKFVNFSFLENENQINLFFDKITFNLIGWQTIDIYQNISITYLSSIKRNQKLKENLFLLPQKK